MDLQFEILVRVMVVDGCWIWQGSLRRGYGRIHTRDGAVSAHRASYEAFVGPIPPGQWVLHSCDTPACVNPRHLRSGAAVDNSRDRTERGRNPQTQKTHCKWGHLFDEENTRITSNGSRRCLACHREEMKKARRVASR